MSSLAESLNRDCRCIGVDPEALARACAALGTSEGLAQLPGEVLRLFASVPVFIAREHVERMRDVVAAVEHVVGLEAYRERVLEGAPALARLPVAARGAFFGYDFHLGKDGPALIEVNTNAGGPLLNVFAARAQRACCEEMRDLVVGPVELDGLDAGFVEMFRAEWRSMRGEAPLGSVAIVDDAPEQQFLHPEFVLFRDLFARHGLRAAIADAAELRFEGGALWHAGARVDLVYNRLTDFYFEHEAHAALRDAYAAGAAVVTPHPRAHALYADKRNLVHLADDAFLREVGADAGARALLAAAVPRARLVRREDADALWRERRRWFFKPIHGFGSKAAYRGDKLTRSTFQQILARDYVAQQVVAPSERHIEIDGRVVPLKLDVRNYVCGGRVVLLAARLYHGQTTNFRTAGGGFAPVFTEAPGRPA